MSMRSVLKLSPSLLKLTELSGCEDIRQGGPLSGPDFQEMDFLGKFSW